MGIRVFLLLFLGLEIQADCGVVFVAELVVDVPLED